MKVSHHYCPPSKSFPPSLMQSLISPDQSVPPLLWRKISISYKKKTSPEGDPPLFSSVQFFPTSVMQSLISTDKSVPQMLWRTISISYKKENFSWRCPTIVQSFPPSLMQSLIFRVAGLALLPRQGCRVPIRLWWVCKTNRLGSNPPSSLFSAGQTRSWQGSVPIKKLFHKGWFPSFPCLKLDI